MDATQGAKGLKGPIVIKVGAKGAWSENPAVPSTA
jgi:hypothetical protein